MRKLKLFLLPLLLIFGACNHNPVEPIIPPSSIVITSITVETTATTVIIRTTVTTNKTTTMTVEYGEGYVNSANTTPDPIKGSMSVSAKISNLTPNTTYPFRFKEAGSNNYFNGSTFTTKSDLLVGDSYKNGIVAEVHMVNGVQHGLLVALVDQSDSTKGMTYAEAIVACAKYGEGYHLPDSTEAKIMKNAFDSGILNNIVKTGVTIYLSSTELKGNNDWIICIDMVKPLLNGYIGNNCINKASRANVRAVCSF